MKTVTEHDLRERTKRFSLRVMKLCASLPTSQIARPIANQLVRSGTSVGANYRAACRSRSRPEFVARFAIAEEEADESAYWMELIIDGDLLRPELVAPLRQEAEELLRILIASQRTASLGIVNRKSKIENPK